MPNPPVHGPRWSWQTYMAGVYLLGFFALLARLLIGTVRAHMLVRRAAKLEGRLTSDACAAPVTVGCMHPTVILPQDWPRWPQAQLDAVLTHEGEHAKWRDPLVQWLALLNRAIFWFHPLAWWLEFKLSALAEEACDAAVLAWGHDPFEYSEYLLEIARAMQRTPARVEPMGMTMPGPFLPQRIRRILEGGRVQRISRMRKACVAIACAGVSGVFTAGAMDHATMPSTAAAIDNLRAVEPAEAPPLPAPPHRKPRVLLAQAQANPTKPADPAPQDGGSILGTVEDPSGARVPGCVIRLRDQAGAAVMSAVSKADGSYRLASVPPGRYTVEYAMRGFAVMRTEESVEAGKQTRIDPRLELGRISSTLTVVGQKTAAPQIPNMAQPAPGPGPISVGGRVENARLLIHAKPIYPPDLRQQGLEGAVLIRATISRDGVPLNPHVLNSYEIDPRFAQAALDAVRQWRYEPAKLNGDPVDVETTIDAMFQLEK